LKLLRSQLVLAQHARIVYCLTLDEGQTYESLFRPETWGHIARDIPAGTVIEVSAWDKSWWAQLYVRSSNNLEVAVAEIQRKVFDDVVSRDEAEYLIEFKGPKTKHRVVRRADKMVMVEGLATKAEAEAWIKSPPLKAAA
jgi:hypothetical protein